MRTYDHDEIEGPFVRRNFLAPKRDAAKVQPDGGASVRMGSDNNRNNAGQSVSLHGMTLGKIVRNRKPREMSGVPDRNMTRDAARRCLDFVVRSVENGDERWVLNQAKGAQARRPISAGLPLF